MSRVRKVAAIVGAVVVIVGLLAGVSSPAAAVDLIGAKVFVSSSSSGSVDGISFASGDILAYDGPSNTWDKVFDASDEGLGSANVDGLHIYEPESEQVLVALSFTGTVNVPGVGFVDDSDVVIWDGIAGTFASAIDGSDIGLTSGGEDIDALTATEDDVAVVSLLGTGSVPRTGGGTLSVPDEDLVQLDDSATFSQLLDSSDVGFTGDLVSAWMNPSTGEIFGSALNGFNIGGLTGDGDDIFVFTGTTGSTSSGTFDLFFDGDLYRFGGEQIDALHIIEGSPPPPGSADLEIQISGPTGALVGDTVDFGVSVTNLGPDPAVNVVVTNTLSPGLGFVSTSGCAGDPSGLPCSLGDIAPSGSAFFTLSALVEPGTAGQSVTSSVEVTSSTADPDVGNNSSSFPVFVSGPPNAVDDGPASGSAPGDPFHTGIDTTFTLAAPGLLANDDLGAPPASIVTFGGGDLGGSVSDNPAGTVAFVGGSGTVEVEADGAVEFVPDTGASGPFTFDYRLQNTGGSSIGTVTIYVGPRPVVMGGDLIYLSTAGSGTVDGIIFEDEDILVYDRANDTWAMHFDGSDVGLGTADVDGFTILEDEGSILLSLTAPRMFPGVGPTDDSDIVEFVPALLGTTTAGSFEFHVDGSDLALTAGGEDIDAVAADSDGDLAISTFGAYNVGGGVAGGDEDVVALNLTGTGPATTGNPMVLLDGSDVGLISEDISGVSFAPDSADIFLANAGVFNLPGVSGDGDDIIVFTGTTGSNTAGTFSTYFAGEDARFDNNQIDGLHVAPGAVANDPPEFVGDNRADPDENQTLAIDLEATDPNGDTEGNGLTYAITGGEDDDLFTIDPATGIVEFIDPPDFEDPDDQDGNNTYQVEFTVTDSGGLFETVLYDIEVHDVVEGASVGNFVWNDLNGNGIQDGGEPGVDGVSVDLLDGDGNVLESATTADGGLYSFAPGAGEYAVRFTAPSGVSFTTTNAGTDQTIDSDADTDGETDLFTLTDGVDDDTIDAGLVIQPASVGDLAWHDADRDGIRDPDEVGLAGVTVRLLDSSASPLGPEDVTDGDGVYGFVGLTPGDYRLEFVPPAATSLSPSGQGNDPAVDSDPNPNTGVTGVVTLAPGQLDVTIDAGIIINEDPTIDTVGPILVDENETSVADIESSDDADGEGFGLVYSIVGTDDGSFFDIDTTSGVLTFSSPPDHEDPQDADTDNDYEIVIRVSDSDGGFAEESFTVRVQDLLEGGSIGDRVWDDVNGNGVQDPTEPGVDGVTVNLLDDTGSQVSTEVTANGGLYRFNVNPGSYRVLFVAPAGKQLTTELAGTDPALDSDPDQATGVTQLITVDDDEDDDTIDAGLVDAATLDFGDAPAAYPVILIDDGARHTIGGPRLGSAIDAEPDGQPSSGGDGDDAADVDDEDGIDISGVFTPGSTNPIGVTASAPGLLNAWVDWDDDGIWESDEVVADDLALTAGETFVQVTAPAGVGTGTVFARFRISTAGGLDPTGPAADGEVEDHPVVIAEPPSISIEKLVEQNGQFVDADTQVEGPEATIGDDVEFQVVVTNVGSEELTAVTLDDDALGIQAVVLTDLAPGESMMFDSADVPGLRAVDYCESVGAVVNTAAVSGTGTTTGLVATDTDDAWVNCVADTETSSTGSGSSFDITQPSLVLNPFIRIVPVPGREIGEIRWSAAATLVDGEIFVKADGRALNRNTFSELFAKIGTTYGTGDGVTTFNIPDLRGRAAVGAHTGRAAGSTSGAPTATLSIANLPSHTHDFANGFTATAVGGDQPFSIEQPNLAIHYGILTQGVYPTILTPGETLSEVLMTAGAPPTQNGHVPANGAGLPTAANEALFSLLGVAYGGDGRTTFQLPNVDGRLTTSIGQGPGLATRTLGSTRGASEVTLTTNTMAFHLHDANGVNSSGAGNGSAFSIVQPELSMQWLIALQGQFPLDADALGGSVPSFGELALLATDTELPNGWARADGALLPIESNTALFALIGAIYGGDAETNFGLPDLRGRTPVGSGTSSFGTFPIGQQSGAEQTALNAALLPAHTHPVVPNP